ncbi:MAG: esterase family protein [Prolixibacteraceae bacterium]|jgi:S-formylglutathione hydrolase FrmB|nr:esterase family protein [Prolixibacteraceae bacterium]MBT6004625.1 esterase family protein [Prolixibacteraceae bacterium]MBT7000207.1 esterase family protein [Prolixibacteraceae bacterium]MBT7393812.1 esterase family protein [Prolixibacteraceae bacterium]
MKKLLFLFIALCYVIALSAQNGKVLESVEFESNLVNYPVEYSIYLPPDYETSIRSYPVLYLLHGYSDDETGWIQFGEANTIADRGIANGDFPPCIIVMPDGKVSWYINSFDGKDPWEEMFITEFIPFIEKEYRIRPKKEFRAIAGLSMGGNGALLLSMRNPELFSSCVAMSAGTFTDNEILANDSYDGYFKNIYGPKPEGKVSDHWKANSPLHLLESVDEEKLKSIRFYIDCGDDDFLYKGNSALHVKMRDLGIPHEYRVRNGGHEWSYWRTGLFDGLKYISEKFHR